MQQSLEDRLTISLAAALGRPLSVSNETFPNEINTMASQTLDLEQSNETNRFNTAEGTLPSDLKGSTQLLPSKTDPPLTSFGNMVTKAYPGDSAGSHAEFTGLSLPEPTSLCPPETSESNSDVDSLLSQFRSAPLPQGTTFPLSGSAPRLAVGPSPSGHPLSCSPISSLTTTQIIDRTAFLSANVTLPSSSSRLPSGPALQPQSARAEEPAFGSDFIDMFELNNIRKPDLSSPRVSKRTFGQEESRARVPAYSPGQSFAARKNSVDDDDDDDNRNTQSSNLGYTMPQLHRHFSRVNSARSGPVMKSNIQVRVPTLTADQKVMYINAPRLHELYPADSFHHPHGHHRPFSDGNLANGTFCGGSVDSTPPSGLQQYARVDLLGPTSCHTSRQTSLKQPTKRSATPDYNQGSDESSSLPISHSKPKRSCQIVSGSSSNDWGRFASPSVSHRSRASRRRSRGRRLGARPLLVHSASSDYFDSNSELDSGSCHDSSRSSRKRRSDKRRLIRIPGSVSPVLRRSHRISQQVSQNRTRNYYNFEHSNLAGDESSNDESYRSTDRTIASRSVRHSATKLGAPSLADKLPELLPISQTGLVICSPYVASLSEHLNKPVLSIRYSPTCFFCTLPVENSSCLVSVEDAEGSPWENAAVGCLCCSAVIHAGCLGQITSRQIKDTPNVFSLDPQLDTITNLVNVTVKWSRVRGWAVGRLSEIGAHFPDLVDRLPLDMRASRDHAVLVCKWCLKTPNCVACLDHDISAQRHTTKASLHSVRCSDAPDPFFRCVSCFRAWHFSHIPNCEKDKYGFQKLLDGNVEGMRLGWCSPTVADSCFTSTPEGDHRWHDGCVEGGCLTGAIQPNLSRIENKYKFPEQGKCSDCESVPGKVVCVLGWQCNRSPDLGSHSSLSLHTLLSSPSCFDLLVQFSAHSLRHVRWVPASWVLATTKLATIRAFVTQAHPESKSMANAISWDEVAIDQVLDVEFSIAASENGQPCIHNVTKALVSFKAFGLESAIWEYGLDMLQEVDPPSWREWERAFSEWQWRQNVMLPSPREVQRGIETFRTSKFVPVAVQPSWVGDSKLPLSDASVSTSLDALDLVSATTSSVPFPNGSSKLTLLPHQTDGLNWLLHHFHTATNALLADEMGLGKTIQIVAFISHLLFTSQVSPWLVVVPGPTVVGWRREFARWAPHISVGVLAGPKFCRELGLKCLIENANKKFNIHVLVASYEAVADAAWSKVFHRPDAKWRGLVVDEAQRLKSGKGPLYDALVRLNIPFRVFLSGTPIQNRPAELFNLLRFLRPGFDPERDLGLETGTSQQSDVKALTSVQIAKLHRILRPLLLRRTKRTTLSEQLPEVASTVIPVRMSGLQQMIYKAILSKRAPLLSSVLRGKASGGSAATGKLRLANTLMQLRKCLCHPWVFAPWLDNSGDAKRQHNSSNLADVNKKPQARDLEGIDIPANYQTTLLSSPKLSLLSRMLPILLSRGHRILIFSQFLNMLDLVSRLLESLQIQHCRIDGMVSSSEKQRQIDIFNAHKSPLSVMLLSTRAGGVGLNLASADTVIVLDPDFNPHQDLQAIGRAHRIGQQKQVHSMHFVTEASVEEKIWLVGQKKVQMEQVLVGGVAQTQNIGAETMVASDDESQNAAEGPLSDNDLASLLVHGAADLFAGDSNLCTGSLKAENWTDEQIEKLIDRSGAVLGSRRDDSFGFARIWESPLHEDNEVFDSPEHGGSSTELQDGAAENDYINFKSNISTPSGNDEDPNFWDQIFLQQELLHKERQDEMATRKRRRTTRSVNYGASVTGTGLSDLESDLEAQGRKGNGDVDSNPDDSAADMNMVSDDEVSDEDVRGTIPLPLNQPVGTTARGLHPGFGLRIEQKDLGSLSKPLHLASTLETPSVAVPPNMAIPVPIQTDISPVTGFALNPSRRFAPNSGSPTHIPEGAVLPKVFSHNELLCGTSLTSITQPVHPVFEFWNYFRISTPSVCPLCALPHLGRPGACPFLADSGVNIEIQSLLSHSRNALLQQGISGQHSAVTRSRIEYIDRAVDWLRQIQHNNTMKQSSGGAVGM